MFDNNGDGHIDLDEMLRGVATCCRRTDEEIHKCKCGCGLWVLYYVVW